MLDGNFWNSLIIHKENTKENWCLMSVWKSDEKLLIFASLISPFKIILFKNQCQAFDTVIYHKMKHPEVGQKYLAARRIFNSLLCVSSGDETRRLLLDTLRLMMPWPPLKIPTHCKRPLIDPFFYFFFSLKKCPKCHTDIRKKIIKANQNRTKQSSLQRFFLQ